MAYYPSLRAANAARQDLWDPTGTLNNWDWRCNELAGEAGEVCNVLKKRHREELGLRGSRATLDQLADELADVVICADLCGLQAGLRPLGWVDEPGSVISLPNAGKKLIMNVGYVCVLSGTEHRSIIIDRLYMVLTDARDIANHTKINLGIAIACKFNETSRKVGLPVFLGKPEDPWYGDDDTGELFANAVQGSSS